MQRTSGPLDIDLDNAEWEKKVMNSWPKKCTFVVREILQTERTYIASLEEIILGYMMPLHGYLLSQGEGPNFIHTVFGNINKLRQLHEQLLDDLYNACGDPHNFANIFIETEFCQYREYCTRYTAANHFLQQSMGENEKLKLFITQCQNDLDHSLPLHTHLIKPVQRILKYQLLLHEMLKYIDEKDVVYPGVKDALEKMKRVAEEINTSFNKEKSNELATPAVIARRRSKEIKSLQRSRSDQRRRTDLDSSIKPNVSELQRSMEFEDSLTLLRSNKQHSLKPNPVHKTVSPGRRQPRPPLTDLIGFFELSKPTQGFSDGPPLTLSPTYQYTTNPTDQSSPDISDGSLSPTADSVVRIQQPTVRKHTSTSESTATGDISENGETSSVTKKSPVLPRITKTPLALQKSAPIVQRSSVVAQGEKGDRNSLLLDTPHMHLDKKQETSHDHDSKHASPNAVDPPDILDVPLTLPQQPYSPTTVPAYGKTKKPLPPPKHFILPDKFLLGQTAHKKPRTQGLRDKNIHHQQNIPPESPLKKSIMNDDNDKKFVINGEPVVSLPPALQHPSPSPPAATFFPSMLKPSKNSTGVRSSVLARQELMIEEMIRGGGASGRLRHTQGQHHNPHTSETVPGFEASRKVPLLPPIMSQKSTPPHSPDQ